MPKSRDRSDVATGTRDAMPSSERPPAGTPLITVFDYDQNSFESRQVERPEDCFPYKDKPTVTWINVDGVNDATTVEKIGKHFDMHPLTLEDIVVTDQRPKVEQFEKYLFIGLKMPHYADSTRHITSEQISIVLTDTCVISFQERPGDVFDAVRDRIRLNKGRIRRMGPDYLVYRLMDAIVDHCFVLLEDISGRVEAIEEMVVRDPGPATLKEIHRLKRELLILRRAVWPMREVAASLWRDESGFIRRETSVFFRDVYDHTVQVIDTIETQRDMVSGMLEIYLSSVSNRLNEVMKVLTIIATIFMPLSFIAGIFGMNFSYDPRLRPYNMPELYWRYGYPAALLLMAIVAGGMLLYFKRKRWL